MRALLFSCLILSNFAFSQSVSILPNQGVEFPQYSTANMLTIASPANGSTIFNIETNTLWTYIGSAWKNLGSGINGTKIQTFIFNNLSWSQVVGTYSRTYSATVIIPELSSAVLNSGLVEVAYTPPFNSTIVFRKLPETDMAITLGGGIYPMTKTFSYELNGISLSLQIPNTIPILSDNFIIPHQIKVTLISPN